MAAIVLQLGEYRESLAIDFLCSDRDGYRLLRNAIAPPTLGAVLRIPVTRIRIDGAMDARLGVPVLSRDDMYAEKLLANADRALDRSQMSRDLIDLAMMIDAWGPIPTAALDKAEAAYGQAISDYFDRGLEILRDDQYRSECLRAMAMDPELANPIIATLETHRPRPGIASP